jgi:hypothetical protein
MLIRDFVLPLVTLKMDVVEKQNRANKFDMSKIYRQLRG